MDADGDGFGGAATVWRCVPDSTTSTVGGDCDDGEATTNPGADEYCDDVDNDCDSAIDERDAVDGPCDVELVEDFEIVASRPLMTLASALQAASLTPFSAKTAPGNPPW